MTVKELLTMIEAGVESGAFNEDSDVYLRVLRDEVMVSHNSLLSSVGSDDGDLLLYPEQ